MPKQLFVQRLVLRPNLLGGYVLYSEDSGPGRLEQINHAAAEERIVNYVRVANDTYRDLRRTACLWSWFGVSAKIAGPSGLLEVFDGSNR